VKKLLAGVLACLGIAVVGLGAAALDERVPIQLASAGDVQELLRLPHAGVAAIAFTADGETLASVDGHLVLRIWDLATGEAVQEIELEPSVEQASKGVFSPDGRLVAVGLPGQSVGVWRVCDGVQTVMFEGETYVMGVQFSPDSKVLAVGRYDGSVELWRVADGALVARWTAHESAVHGLAFSLDGDTFATGSINRTYTIRLWSLGSGERLAELTEHREDVYGLLFVDGAQLLSASGDRTAFLWDVASGDPVRTFRGHADIVNEIALSPNGDLLATAGSDRTVRLWDFAEAETIAILRGHTTYVLRAVFSPRGDLLASCTLNVGQGGEVIVWGVPEGGREE